MCGEILNDMAHALKLVDDWDAIASVANNLHNSNINISSAWFKGFAGFQEFSEKDTHLTSLWSAWDG